MARASLDAHSILFVFYNPPKVDCRKLKYSLYIYNNAYCLNNLLLSSNYFILASNIFTMNSQQQQEMIVPPASPVGEIMPPAPPVVQEESFIPGEFAYADKWDKSYLKDAYQVISRNEWWGPFKKALIYRGVDSSTGFQFSTDPFYNKVMDAIASTPIGGGHSGSSIGATMRVMQTIALYGEAEYRRQCIAYQAEEQKNKTRQEEFRRIMEEIELEYQELRKQIERRQFQRQAMIQECQQHHFRNLVNNAFDYEEIVEEPVEELL
jgi:hypothetical protein